MKFFFLFAFIFLLSSCTGKKEIISGTQDLSALLEISKTNDERPLSASMLAKKIVILNFWASWCAPCMEETPALLKLASNHKKNIVLISVSEDESKKSMQSFLKLFPLAKSENVFLYHDLNRKWSQSFGIYKLPETFIFDHRLQLVKKIEGSFPFEGPEIQKLISELTKKID